MEPAVRGLCDLGAPCPGLVWGGCSKDSQMQPDAWQREPAWWQTLDGSASQSTVLGFSSPIIPVANFTR